MCFAPQRRALFSTSQLPKVLRSWCVLYMWLRNVLRATTACTFSTSQLPKVVKAGAVYILTWKCASHHNGVQLSSLIWPHRSAPAALASLLFESFRPSGATNHSKNRVFRDFPTFSRTWIFFLRRLSLFDLLSSSLLFSDSSHLCFSSFHIVGSLTSKLPSINYRVKHSNGTFMFTLFSITEYNVFFFYHGDQTIKRGST